MSPLIAQDAESNARVLGALRGVLLAVPEMAEVERKWENRLFTPARGVPFVSDHFVPGRNDMAGWAGDRLLIRNENIYMVEVFVPANAGTALGFRLAGALCAAFHPRASASYEGQDVTIRRSYAGRATEESDWYHIPVTIEWRADALSPA